MDAYTKKDPEWRLIMWCKCKDKVQLRGINIGDKLSYRFYDGQYHGVPLLFAEPKGDAASPRLLAATAENFYNRFQRHRAKNLFHRPPYTKAVFS